MLLLLIFFTISNVKSWILATNHFGLSSKIAAVKYSSNEVGNSDFELDSLGNCFAQGYLYLFWYFGHLPTKSTGLIFDPAYFKEQKKVANFKVVLVNPSTDEGGDFFKKYADYKSRARIIHKIDDIEILILEDHKL